MNNVTILIGVPRSGKTKYVKENHKDDSVISRDLIRVELGGTKDYFDEEEKVTSIFWEQIETATNDKKNIVIDNTNLKYKYRKPLYDFFAKKGYDIEIVIFRTNINTLLKRAEDTNFPKNIIIDMIKGYELFNVKYKEDGFSRISHISTDNYTSDLKNYLNEAEDFNQQNEHHSLSLGKHMRETLISLKGEEKELELAGLLHDIGKIYTKTPTENPNNFSYKGHAEVSGYIVDCLPYPVGYSKKQTILLIINHMMRFQDVGKKFWKKYNEAANRLGVKDGWLQKLWEADKSAH